MGWVGLVVWVCVCWGSTHLVRYKEKEKIQTRNTKSTEKDAGRTSWAEWEAHLMGREKGSDREKIVH